MANASTYERETHARLLSSRLRRGSLLIAATKCELHSRAQTNRAVGEGPAWNDAIPPLEDANA